MAHDLEFSAEIGLDFAALAVAATGLARHEEAQLFRFTLRHSIFLGLVMSGIVVYYAYVAPGWVRSDCPSAPPLGLHWAAWTL